MSQILSPLYGDYLNDTFVARSSGQRPGFLVAPAWSQAASGADVAVTLGTDPDLGFWAWKTRWLPNQGAFTFTEDANVVVTSLDATANPYQLLVGRWQWTTGSLDVNGHPNGDYESGMHPVYQFEAGVAGDMVDDLIHTSIAQPDSNGRYGVVLGLLNHGVFSTPSATMLDQAKLATQRLPIAMYIKAPGLAPAASPIRFPFTTVKSTGDVPTVNGDGDLVVQRAGFYQIAASLFMRIGTANYSDLILKKNGTIVDQVTYLGAPDAPGMIAYGDNLAVGDVLSFQYDAASYTVDIRIQITRA